MMNNMQDITTHDTFKTVIKALSLCLPTTTLYALKNVTEDDLCLFHFGLGTWLRNDLLVPEAALFQFFVKNGITHADDMSGIIIRELWKHLRNGKLVEK